MYSNLRLEMIKKGVTVTNISKVLGKRRSTIGDKINGKYRIYLDEAKVIQKEFFPNYSIEYLFGDSEKVEEGSLEVIHDEPRGHA